MVTYRRYVGTLYCRTQREENSCQETLLDTFPNSHIITKKLQPKHLAYILSIYVRCTNQLGCEVTIVHSHSQ